MGNLELVAPTMAYKEQVLANSGVLENEVEDVSGLGESGVVRRYWITF